MQSSPDKMRYLCKHTKSLGIYQLIEARRIFLWLPRSHKLWLLLAGICYSGYHFCNLIREQLSRCVHRGLGVHWHKGTGLEVQQASDFYTGGKK